MRLLQLVVGLVGLAEVAFAAPASLEATTAGILTTAEVPDLASDSGLAAPGDTIICQNTIDNGPCERINAQDRCVSLSGDVSYKVRTIYQNVGSVCKYFESDCSTRNPVVSVDSHKKALFLQFDKKLGDKIGLVLCRYNWPTTELEAGTASVETRDVDATSAYPGDIRVCNTQQGGKACVYLHTLYKCSVLPEGFSYRAESIRQAQGAVCKYFDSTCAEPKPVFEASSRSYAIDLTGGGLRAVGAVFCMDALSAATLEADPAPIIADAGPINVAISTSDRAKTVRSTNARDPIYVCHEPNLTGACFSFKENRRWHCNANPFNVDRIQSLSVERGYRCAFYQEPNCEAKTLPHFEGDRYETKQLNTVPYDIVSMICGPFPSLGDDDETSSTNVRRAEGPGDTRICDRQDFSECRDNVNAMDRCSSFDPGAGGPSSLIQFQGAFCKWYRGYGCSRESKDYEPMVLDSRVQTVSMGELGADNNLFKSVRCQAGPF